jgi:hydroxypyruvate isomerase
MRRFDVNIQALFNEVPLLERFESVSKAGFTAVEMSVPYLSTPTALREKLEEFQLQAVLINSPGGDPLTQRGLACQPTASVDFRASLNAAVEMATALRCPLVHCPAGMAPAGESHERIAATYFDNIAFAADFLQKAGIKLGIEPINSYDLAGYYLSSSQQAVGLMKAWDHPNIGMVLDFYHLARMGEDIPAAIRASAGKILHVQIADAPGKGEPGTGMIDFGEAFAALEEVGYDGWIGLEYRPQGDTTEGLSWLAKYDAGAVA